jgi:hypothetical protein
MERDGERLREITAALAVGACLALLGHLLVIERTFGSRLELLRIRGDALHYLSMAEWSDADVPAPFRYRVVAPWIVARLGLGAGTGFRLLSSVAMALTYALTYGIARRCAISRVGALVGVLLVWAAPWSLYVFHNPALPDAAAHLVVAAEVACLVGGAVVGFVVLVALGTCVRESSGVLAPALWVLGRRRTAALLTLAVVSVFVGFRVLDPGEESLVQAARGRFTVDGIVALGRDAYLAWGGLWFVAVGGLGRLPAERRGRVRAAAVWLLWGGLAGALVAADAGRMLAFLLVPFGVAAAAAVDHLCSTGRRGPLLLRAAAAALGAVAWMPNRVLAPEGAVFGSTWLRVAAGLLSPAAGIAAGYACGRDVMDD